MRLLVRAPYKRLPLERCDPNVTRRPNVLFLMSDEHRPDVVGYEGNDVVRTPFLDWLAATGVVFRNAYTPSPICIPSRQAMMSGKLPRSCGCERYGDDLPPFSMTFARRLAQYGYDAVASGKLHHLGPDQMQGWTRRLSGDMSVAPRYIEGQAKEAAGVRRTVGDVKWSDAKEIKRAGVGRGPCVESDEFAVEHACRFIKEYFTDPYYDRERPNQPLLLKVSLLQPHYPYLTDEEKFAYYLSRVRPFEDRETIDHPFLWTRAVRVGVDASSREIRRATAAYYGMIESVDRHFRRVAAALSHVGQDLDDWIVIYTSDHGEMLGEHGVWEKQKFFEASVRVPLLIRFPKRFAGGRVVRKNVNLCDLFATLCDLTDIPVPAGLDSRSLIPLMDGVASDWNNETVSQFRGTNLMIKWDDVKYQYYGEDMPEVLFDLSTDPNETTNAIDDPKHADIVDRFRRRRAELGFGPDADPGYTNAGYAAG